MRLKGILASTLALTAASNITMSLNVPYLAVSSNNNNNNLFMNDIQHFCSLPHVMRRVKQLLFLQLTEISRGTP